MSAVVTGPVMAVGVDTVEGVEEEDTAMAEDSGEPDQRRYFVWTS